MLQPGQDAREIEAVGVGAERADLLRVVMDLADRPRRLVGVEPGLLEQVLVPDEDRDVGREAGAVELALVGGDVLVGLGDAGVVRIGLEVAREVDEEAGLHEVRHVDEVERDEVRDLAGLHAGRELGHHLVVGDGRELDLVLVGRIPEIDHVRGGVGAAGAHPHRHRVGEGGAHESGGAEGRGGHGRKVAMDQGVPPGLVEPAFCRTEKLFPTWEKLFPTRKVTQRKGRCKQDARANGVDRTPPSQTSNQRCG